MWLCLLVSFHFFDHSIATTGKYATLHASLSISSASLVSYCANHQNDAGQQRSPQGLARGRDAPHSPRNGHGDGRARERHPGSGKGRYIKTMPHELTAEFSRTSSLFSPKSDESRVWMFRCSAFFSLKIRWAYVVVESVSKWQPQDNELVQIEIDNTASTRADKEVLVAKIQVEQALIEGIVWRWW